MREQLLKEAAEKWEKLTITDDFIFAKVMRDKTICQEVLERLLQIKISDIVYLEEQKTVDIAFDAKSVRLDVYVEDGKRIFDIEMQTANNRDLAKRSRYYQSMMDLNAIEKGAIYKSLKESYVIFICTFDPFKEGLSRYDFEQYCKQNKGLCLNDGAHKLFLNASAYEREETPEVKHFLQYVAENKVNNEDAFISRVAKRIEAIKTNREWRVEYMTLYVREMEIKEESLAEGLAKGMVKGRQEGMKTMQYQIAKSLLDKLSDQEIAETTGLMVEQVRKLRVAQSKA